MTSPVIKGLECPGCGAAIELRAGTNTRSVVCPACRSVLSASESQQLRILQRFAERQGEEPVIPLGTRGTLKGEKWEVVGFQVRYVEVEGTKYRWREYVLFNPYKGFRYLTEYNGHWNDVIVVKHVPQRGSAMGRPTATYLGETFRHFQRATARTEHVLGEFPWEVRVGDSALTNDFVAPPRMLSEETTDGETTWSLATYTPPEQIREAFGLKKSLRSPQGVFANQPSPHGPHARSMWQAFGVLLVGFLALWLVRIATARSERVLRERHEFLPPGGDSAAFVTAPFDLEGGTRNVEVQLETNLSNSWAYFQLALIDERTGRVYDFARDVSYYYGRDSDGNWSEGSRRDRVRLPSVPDGRYYLRVQPEGPADAPSRVAYTLSVRRDVPTGSFFFLGFLALLVPPVIVGIRAWGFEHTRWQASDYAATAGDDDGDDE